MGTTISGNQLPAEKDGKRRRQSIVERTSEQSTLTRGLPHQLIGERMNLNLSEGNRFPRRDDLPHAKLPIHDAEQLCHEMLRDEEHNRAFGVLVQQCARLSRAMLFTKPLHPD